jgi:hypothetical protein
MPYYPPATVGGSGTITTKDEGSTLSSTVTALDFVGAGVTASGAGATTTVTIAGAAGASWTKYELDFGSAAGITEKTFIITDAACTGTSKVIVVASGETATNRSAGDALFDAIVYAATPGTGQFTLYANSPTSSITGKRYIYYTIA